MTDLQAWLDERVQQLRKEHDVVGMCAGVLHRGDRAVAAAGVTNLRTGVEVTRDTLFQIGSNTKLWTATAAMRLAEQGLLSLDTRVVDVVPGFQLATPGADEITVRHLLTHTSGIDGDVTGPETGWAPDMVQLYVDGLREVPLLHPVGRLFSYCNSGWVVLGRVIESVTGLTYEEALRSLVLTPLGSSTFLLRPEEILLHRAAVGHLPLGPDGANVVAPMYAWAPACAPAGSIPVSSVDEVLDFVAMHLGGGAPVLSAETAGLMRQPQLEIPPTRDSRSIGLGWFLSSTTDGRRVVGHGGGTLGQLSILEAIPDEELVVVVLTNSLSGGMAGVQLVNEAFRELVGAERPTPPREVVPTEDLVRYEGRYERHGTTVTVTAVDGGLECVVEESAMYPGIELPPRRMTLHPVGDDRFGDLAPDGMVVRFLEPDDSGRPTYLFNFRLLRRA